MLTLVPKRLVTKLTGFAFVLAIVAAMGVGVFSPASTDAASSAQSPDQLIEWQAPQVFGWEGISITEAASPARFSSSYFNPVERQPRAIQFHLLPFVQCIALPVLGDGYMYICWTG